MGFQKCHNVKNQVLRTVAKVFNFSLHHHQLEKLFGIQMVFYFCFYNKNISFESDFSKTPFLEIGARDYLSIYVHVFNCPWLLPFFICKILDYQLVKLGKLGAPSTNNSKICDLSHLYIKCCYSVLYQYYRVFFQLFAS